eukprot:CAMPEP_0114501264 /NCGR_PEP_ID=MMETSP0109-20121206/8404_1 /TAXON_ID=29199 /ORGANISM="Chlorarachnion reptans, Strain CCCM449" /LENGTH=823 /DNA_ID=CAMNT_0001678979 /DNA_START=195 /DNA_END=2667 /DNA_ORIENTATION=+
MSHRAYYSGVAIDASREPFRITSLEACGRRIVLGCSDGLIRVFEDRSQPNGKVDYKPTSVSEVFTRKSVESLKVFPLHGIMVSLSDGVLRLHSFPSLETRGTFEKSRGCLSFVSNYSTDKKGHSDDLCLCLALKRRVQLFRWNPREFSFANIQELTLNETPRRMEWAGANSVCVAFKRDYKMLNTKTGHCTQIFPLGRKGPQGGLICRMEASNEVLLAKNQQGICVNHEGKPTRTEPIEWSEPPGALLYCRPYVIAATSSEIDVRNIENRLPVQTVSLKGATMLASTFLAERMLVAASSVTVMQLTPVSPINQVEELVAKCNFEAALQLIEEDLDSKWIAHRDEHRLKVKTQYAYHLYNQKEFEMALHLFQQTKIDPRQVLALFPKIIPKGQCRKIEHPVEHIVPIERRDEFLKATAALIPYLEHLRNRFSMDPRYTVTSKDWRKSKSGDMTLPALVDTALLLVFLEIDDPTDSKALLAFLKQDTECDLALTEEILTRRGKYKELVAFFKIREQHESALAILKKLAQKGGGGVTKDKSLLGPGATIDYLQSLAPDRDYQDIVIKYAEWVVKDHPKEGLKIFTHSGSSDSKTKSHIPARLVLKLLKNWCGPEIVVTYLESYLKSTDNKNSALHNELVFLYLDLIHKAEQQKSKRSKKQSAVGPTDVPALRRKLIQFLRESKHYKPELMLGRFPEAELLEERAVLLSRLNEHVEALALYVWDLGSEDKAIRYCAENYDEGRKEKNDVYLHLMQVYLEPEKLEPTERRKAATPKVDAAIELLGKNYMKMDVARAMKLLSDDLDVKRVFPILRAVLSMNKTDRGEIK